jgi:hypothetical protein
MLLLQMLEKKERKAESARLTVATESLALRNELSKAVINSGVTSRRSCAIEKATKTSAKSRR